MFTIHNLILAALVVAFAYLQYRDVATTNAGQASGRAREANPIMAKWQALTGKWWWAIKVPYVLAIAGFAYACAATDHAFFAAAMLSVLCVFYYANDANNAAIAKGD